MVCFRYIIASTLHKGDDDDDDDDDDNNNNNNNHHNNNNNNNNEGIQSPKSMMVGCRASATNLLLFGAVVQFLTCYSAKNVRGVFLTI